MEPSWLGVILRWAIGLTLLAIFLPGPVDALVDDYGEDLDHQVSKRAEAQYARLKAHLEEPFEGYGTLDVFVPAFGVVMLSHTACGLLNLWLHDPSRTEEFAPLFEELISRARDRRLVPRGSRPELDAWSDENLYISHLAVILGCRRLAGGDPRWDGLHRRLAEGLHQRSIAAPRAHVRSYAGSSHFPADQSVVLLALAQFDHIHGTDLAVEPTQTWFAFMENEGTHAPSRLPRSCIDDEYPGAALPRGCALSWTCLYMAQFAPHEASELYWRYRDHFYDEVGGCGGFREWPEGEASHMDFDSGPIILGLGLAASGIGLGAARIHGDRAAYRGILRSGATLGLPTFNGDRSHWLSPWLGEAILFHGLTARPWFEPPKTKIRNSPATTPIFSIGVAAVVLLVAIWPLWSGARRARRILSGE